LSERRHLFGLQQLVIDVAGLVVQFLALADVAYERFDAAGGGVVGRIGAGGELDPHRVSVGATQAEEVVVDRPVGGQALEQRDPGLRIDEAVAIKRADV
jgi:hypothetical protein